MDGYILALDEGTTSARAIIWDKQANVKGIGQYEFRQIYPKPGWVEQDPNDIWEAQLRAIKDAISMAKIEPNEIKAIGITNQRETTILWDKNTGKPVYNAIVWQCRRTAEIVDKLKSDGHADLFKKRTGLVPDSYFSGPKIKWILENVPGAKEKAQKGELLFGTIDTYLIWKLTGGESHYTDFTNASRTMIFDIRKLKWDEELLEILGIPEEILPTPTYSSELMGETKEDIFGAKVPITGAIGDQQAALVGQAGFEPGMVKCTYGTGNFVLVNTGDTAVESSAGLLTTVAYSFNRQIRYALEGSIFVTGRALQWLRDGVKILENVADSEKMAESLASNDGLYFVPAFVGLGAPYWDQYARGLIIGITSGTTREHIVRAALEGIAYLTRDVIEVMEKESKIEVSELRVDGGAVKNNFLMQFQADILGKNIVRPVVTEITALGAAYMAGLRVEYWESIDEIRENWKVDRVFQPKLSMVEREKLYSEWKRAVHRALNWAKS
ncbi:MAG: glycerol kinase GlpK [Candidatus Odinarchaeota archaeon]|nr:glycerol kinase GlpK [Candidatus Odinarchaeota archaeon]